MNNSFKYESQNQIAGFECDTDIEDLRLHTVTCAVAFLPNQRLYLVPHNHPCFELHLLVSGSVNMVTTEGSYPLSKNDLCLLPPRLYHNAQELVSPISAISFFLTYSKTAAPSAHGLYDAFDAKMRSFATPQRFERAFAPAHALLELTEEMGRWLPGKKDRLKTKTAEILFSFIDLICPELRGEYTDNLSPSAKQMLAIDAFFAHNHQRNVTLKDLADTIFLSERHANRILLDLYGMTFKQKLIETRVHVAMQLLQYTDLSVNEISERSGYRSAVGFHTAFRAACQMTPAKYRSMARKKSAAFPAP